MINNIIKNPNFYSDNQVIYLSETHKFNDFEENYINLRKSEKRILNDDEVKILPETGKNHIYSKEWKIRKKSTNRFLRYLKKKNSNLKILEIGCGNGWFLNKLSEIKESFVVGLDVNKIELEQAARVFKKENLAFIYADIFDDIFNENVFDIIVFNASLQYFTNIEKLFAQLKKISVLNAEIHIIDTKFYAENEKQNAQKRSEDYYKSIGFSEMLDYYNHLTFNDLSIFNSKYLYKPINNRILKKVICKNSPFPWLVIYTKPLSNFAKKYQYNAE
ncbi:MAG: class I SAM-dependent methyltransferase [Bacteroidales bacterium]|nr:class I SAM-dependent methyltransferase [Bacteroidales bacterium]MBN2757932.1 class I SAM-dependent methyltransferase [Bacteroidales bacterium]